MKHEEICAILLRSSFFCPGPSAELDSTTSCIAEDSRSSICCSASLSSSTTFTISAAWGGEVQILPRLSLVGS